MDTGKANWAVQLYLDLKRKERAIETAEKKLQSWLSSLNAEEFAFYVDRTTELDRREAERQEE
jgi:hypothetical protein